MNLRVSTLAVLALLPTVASAQVYKCDVGGKTVYQERPCAGRGEALDIVVKPPMKTEPVLSEKERLQADLRQARKELWNANKDLEEAYESEREMKRQFAETRRLIQSGK